MEGENMSVNISFGAINVNSIMTNGAVSTGENNQTGWSAHSKNNYGNSQFVGWSYSGANLNNLLDNDVIDAPITNNEAVPGNQNQSV